MNFGQLKRREFITMLGSAAAEMDRPGRITSLVHLLVSQPVRTEPRPVHAP